MSTERLVDGYAYGKLSELAEELFCDVRPAREKLLDHYAMIFIIAPSDFKTKKLQAAWAAIQRSLNGKTTNYGTERSPRESISVRNATLEKILRAIWNIYGDVRQDG